MIEFVRYSFLWFFGAFCGWVIEILFRRFVSQKKWVNPGFLSGPCVPLYGFGTVAFYLFNGMPWFEWIPITWLAYLCELLFIAVVLTVIEWIAGIIFVKGMHIKLWDYSRLWGNIQGIICPLFSLIWMIAGAAYVFLLANPMITMSNYLVTEDHILYTACTVFFCYGVFIVDFGYNLHIVSKVRKFVNDRKTVVDWKKLKVSFNDQKQTKIGSIGWFFPFGDKKGEKNKIKNPNNKKITFTFAGTISSFRTIDNYINAIEMIIEKYGNIARFIFVCNTNESVNILKRHSCVEIYNNVSYEDSLKFISNSD